MYGRISVAEAASLLKISTNGVHKRLKDRGLVGRLERVGNRVYFGHEIAKELLDLTFPKTTLTFHVVKGGTGKTTLAHEVGIRANLLGASVLFVDLDQQANLSMSVGVRNPELPTIFDFLTKERSVEDLIVNVAPGLDLIPSGMRNAQIDFAVGSKNLPVDRIYRNIVGSVRERYDLIVIDCPPALGGSVAAAWFAADTVVLPIDPDDHSVSGLNVSLMEMKRYEADFEIHPGKQVVINKYDARTTASTAVLSALLEHEGLKEHLCPSYIRRTQEFVNARLDNTTIFEAPRPTAAKEDIDLLLENLLNLTLASSKAISKSA